MSHDTRELTVAKKPLGHLPAEQRSLIAQSVLARYMQGEQVADMAGEYGTSDVTLYAVLLREHEDEWKEAQTARAMARFERAQKKVSCAPDQLSLACAREELRSAQWELERLLRRLYGQDQAATQMAAISINIGIVRRDTSHNPGNDSQTIEQVIDKT